MTLRMKLKNIRKLYEKCSKRVGWQRLFMKEIIKQIICKFKSFRYIRNIRKGSLPILFPSVIKVSRKDMLPCNLFWCVRQQGHSGYNLRHGWTMYSNHSFNKIKTPALPRSRNWYPICLNDFETDRGNRHMTFDIRNNLCDHIWPSGANWKWTSILYFWFHQCKIITANQIVGFWFTMKISSLTTRC